MNICNWCNLKVLFLLVSNVFSAFTISVILLPAHLKIAIENECHYPMQMLTHEEDIPLALQ